MGFLRPPHQLFRHVVCFGWWFVLAKLKHLSSSVSNSGFNSGLRPHTVKHSFHTSAVLEILPILHLEFRPRDTLLHITEIFLSTIGVVTMTDKRRVFVGICHRDELSLKENRERLGSAAYHWSIIVAPKGVQKSDTMSCDVYEVTNGVSRGWWLRHTNAKPQLSSTFLCMIMIGKIPNTVDPTQLTNTLISLPFPNRHLPNQGCLWWTMQAVGRLQSLGLAENFAIKKLEAKGVEHADESLKELRSGKSKNGRRVVFNFTKRPL